jgi:hypothetical protein
MRWTDEERPIQYFEWYLIVRLCPPLSSDHSWIFMNIHESWLMTDFMTLR